MKITLHSNYDSNIPLEVDGIRPDVIGELLGGSRSVGSVRSLPIWRGRRRQRLDDFFDVTEVEQLRSDEYGEGSVDCTIHWEGNLSRVFRIGESMTSGSMTVAGDCGRHVGERMSGGRLSIEGNVGEHLGTSMTGGRIIVFGNAADHVGSVLPGAKLGMNRGEIFVQGNVGRGVGQAMRRGAIVVGGSAGDLTGWNMVAGTILVFEGMAGFVGPGMKRGTIIDARSARESTEDSGCQNLLPSFVEGRKGRVPILSMIKNWLAAECSSMGASIFRSDQLERLAQPYRLFHGDILQGGNGEVFVLA